MSIPARHLSSSTLSIPDRNQVSVSDRGVIIPSRHASTVQRSGYMSSMTLKRMRDTSQLAVPFTLPMPPELPPAMTVLLPLTTSAKATANKAQEPKAQQSPASRHRHRSLNLKKYVAATFVQNLLGNWFDTYRALAYMYCQQITRRIQVYLGVISIFPSRLINFLLLTSFKK